MEEHEKDTPISSTTTVKEDILTKVLGPEKNSYLRAYGRGVTQAKLEIVSERDDHIILLEGQVKELKEQMTHMEQLMHSFIKNQASIINTDFFIVHELFKCF